MAKQNIHFNNKTQIALICLVLFIGVGGTALGALNVRSSILNPFNYEGSNSVTVPNTLSQEGSGLLDTDEDGLLDTEELNNYGTSPYLADSDSDGVTDYDEVKIGTDPNCPTGADCGFNEGGEVNEVPRFNDGSNFIDGDVDRQVSVSQLRAVLINEGVSEEQLNSLTDEQLLAAYNQALASRTVNEESKIEYKNLTASEVRNLLKKQGVDQGLINSLTDQEILDLYKTTLNQIDNSNE